MYDMSDHRPFETYKIKCPCCSKYIESAFYWRPQKDQSRTVYRGLKPGKKKAEKANRQRKKAKYRCEHCFCDLYVKFLDDEAEAGSDQPFAIEVIEEGMTREINDDDFFYFLDQ